MPQPPSRAESSRHAQKMPRNDCHRQKSGTISRGKWSSSQRHAHSSQEVPSTFSQESNRRRATASKSQRQEPDIGEEASEYEEEFQRHSQIDLQLHGERSLAKDGRLNARHFTSSPLSSPPRDSQSHRQLSKDPESVYDDPAGSSQVLSPLASSQITSRARQKSRTHQREPTPSSQKSRSDRQIPESSQQNSESSSATPAVDSTESGKGRVFRTRGLKRFDMSYRFILEKAGWDITKETLFVNPLPSVMEMPVMIRKAWDSATEGSEHTEGLTLSVSAQIRYYHQRARSHMMEKAKSFVTSSYGLQGLSPEKLKDRVDYLLTDDRFNCDPEHYEPVEWHFSVPQIPRFIVYCYYKTNRGIAVNHPEFESCINHTFICLVSTVLYHALRVHVVGGSSWKNGVFNKDYCGIIYERQVGTWNRSFPDAESSMLVLTGIRQEIIKHVKLTNSCKLPSMESREALVDPGVGSFLAGLRAKRSAGNPSGRQLVLEDDERANTAVESEDSQDNVPVRRRGSRRRGRGRRAR